MAALSRQAADLIVTSLNAGTFTRKFTACRSYAGWQLALKDIDEMRVDVVPVAFPKTGLDSDGSYSGDLTIDVVVRDRLTEHDVNEDGSVPNDVLDPLVDTVEEINEHFLTDGNRLLSTIAMVRSENGCEIMHLYSPDHLPTQFIGVVRLRFETYKVL